MAALSTANLQVGSRAIFLPDQPGVYVALQIEPNEISPMEELSETQS